MTNVTTNTAPYFDDFDPSKNYVDILFKPGLPVQTRELNQIQSIKKFQLGAISDNYFKNGSIVKNTRAGFFIRAYVRCMDLDTESNIINLSSYIGYNLVGETSSVAATLNNWVPITETAQSVFDPATIYVSYTETGSDGETTTFIPGEVVQVKDSFGVVVKRFTVRCPGCPGSTLSGEISPIGKGYLFSVDSGIVYYNKNYVSVQNQEIICEKYNILDANGYNISTYRYKVGLDYIEEIITVEDDISLYDNTLGYPNAGAIGADRLKVSLTLTVREYDDADGDNFILFAKVSEYHTVQFMKNDSDYNVIMDTLAQRTFETSGNFTVTPFTTKFYNSLKISAQDASGWDLAGDENQLITVVSPGIGYIRGYRQQKIASTVVIFDKARDVTSQEGFTQGLTEMRHAKVTVTSNAVWANESSGSTVFSNMSIFLYDGPLVGGVPTGTQIGFMSINDQNLISGSSYKVYINNITIVSGKWSDVKSMKSATNNWIATPVLESGSWQIHNPNNTSLIFPIAMENIESLRSIDDPDAGSTQVTVRRKLTGNSDTNGVVIFTTPTNDSFASWNPTTSICFSGTGVEQSLITLNSSMVSITGNTLTLNLGTVQASRLITFITDITRTEQKENTKTLVQTTFNTATTINGAVDNSQITLNHIDVFKLVSVFIVNPSDVNFVPVDVTEKYTLYTNQSDMRYGTSYMKLNSAISNVDANWVLQVTVHYFQHTTSNGGYYSIDSYAQMINDPSFDYTYADVPKYTTTNGVTYDLAEVMDYRVDNPDGTADVNATIPSQASTAIFDISYFLPRIDLLQINKNGYIYIKKGIPSLRPRIPSEDSDAMGLYEIHLKAYTYSLNDVETNFIDNRVYSMADIGKIETRLTNLEYYTSLNLLQQSTYNMNIQNIDGLNSFKNGFLVDSFKDFTSCDATNTEFKCSLDRASGDLRPQCTSYSVKLSADKENSKNVVWFGNVGMMPYSEVPFIQNPYATNSSSINPYLIVSKVGSVVLSPSIDTWADTTRLPALVTNINTGTDALKQVATAAGVLGTDWGSWANLNTTVQSSSNTVAQNDGSKINTTTTQSTVSSERTVTTKSMESRSDSYNIADAVTSVQMIPYVRGQIVEFYASKMKTNTRVYAFFNGTNVTQHCRTKVQILNAGTAAQAAMTFGGAPLMTDSDGNLVGQFKIPAGTFYTGQLPFMLTDDASGEGKDTITTSANTVFFAGGIQQSTQQSTLNVVSPIFTQTSSRDSQTNTSISTSVTVTPAPVPPVPPVSPITIPATQSPVTVPRPSVVPANVVIPRIRSRAAGSPWRNVFAMFSSDPVAQSFKLDESCFITRIDLFFKSVDNTSNQIWVQIRPLVNGYPSSDTIITDIKYTPADINPYVSEDGTKAFPVVLPIPIYLDAGTQYCFIVGGYSPDTKVWISTLGETALNIPGKVVETPPTGGVMFSSVNGETWNAEQTQNITFNLYQAEFTTDTMSIPFYNEESPSLELPLNPYEVQSSLTSLRVYAPNHGVSVNDLVSLSFFDNVPFTVQVGSSAPPQIGQTITTATGAGFIVDVDATSSLTEYTIKCVKTSGLFVSGQAYTCDAIGNPSNSFLLLSNGNSADTGIVSNESLGTISSDITESLQYNTFGGVSLGTIAAQQTVTSVDSIDSFIVTIQGTFNTSGRFGGENCSAWDISRKYDVFNIAASFLPYNCTGETKASMISHQTNDYQVASDIPVIFNSDMFLANPMKMASRQNETRVFGTNRKSVKMTSTYVSPSNLISPVINVDALSMICVSNRLGNENALSMDVSPNAVGRYKAETTGSIGSASYKYVTQLVNLINPASDLNVYVNVYHDISADFDIYIKVIEPTNTTPESDIPWILADGLVKGTSSTGPSDYIEYNVQGSKHFSEWDADVEYSQFRVKLVGKGTNSCKGPLFKSLRCIAIT